MLGEDILSVGTVTFGPQLALLAAPGDYITARGTYKTDVFAAFGQTTYSFTEEWLLTLGLRYTAEDKSVDGFVENFSTAPAANIPGVPTFVDLIAAPGGGDEHLEQDGFTWLANLLYFIADDTMAFAAVATGSKSPGFNNPGDPQIEFDEGKTINYELGVKTELFKNRLKLNATAFYSEFDDLQFLTQKPIGAGTFVSNAAKAEIEGVDLGFTASPLPNLIVDGGLQAVPFTMPPMDELVTVYEGEGPKVEALAVDHSPVEPAVGYRFTYKDRSLLITGDTVKLASIEQFARGVDLLVHEALAPNLGPVNTN